MSTKKNIDYEKNRYRKHLHSIRLSDDEEAIVQMRMSRTNLNFTEYMVKMAVTDGKIVIENYDRITELSRELNKIGININQIAHKVNANGFVMKEDIEAVKKEQEKIWGAVSEILKQERRKKGGE